MKKVFLFLMLGLVCMTSCKKDDESVALTDITVTPSTLSLIVGGQQAVTATAVPKEATGVSFVWSSSDESVATVTQGGIVAALKVGTATVTVKSGTVSKTVPVTVSEEVIPLVSVTATPSEVTRSFEDTARIVATAVPSTATGVTFSWASADESIATVDQTGLITITGVGTTTVTVTGAGADGTKTATVSVVGTIKDLATADENDESSGVILPGSTMQLRVTFEPAEAEVTATWRSGDETVATVDATGVVRVIAFGSTTIYATVGDLVAEYALSTDSPLSDAKGYWLFDDPANLGKSVVGEDLIVNTDVVTVVAGPSESNGAVRGDWVNSGSPNIANITWNHTLPGQFENNTKIWNYTVMMDVKVLYQDDQSEAGLRQIWDPVMANGIDHSPGVFLLWVVYPPDDGDQRGVGIAMNMDGGYRYLDRDRTYTRLYPDAIRGNEEWFRFIYTMTYSESEQTWRVYGYMNGTPNKEEPSSNGGGTYPALTSSGACVPDLEIRVGQPLYFMTNRKGDKRHKGQYDMSSLAVWDRVLTDQEIEVLGGISR